MNAGLLVVDGPIAQADVHDLCARLTALAQTSDARFIACDVGALPATIGSLDALARLQLEARRLDRAIRLQRASPELVCLLCFTGLAGVLPLASAARLGAAGGERHAEEREHPRRVEEAVDRGDPPV